MSSYPAMKPRPATLGVTSPYSCPAMKRILAVTALMLSLAGCAQLRGDDDPPAANPTPQPPASATTGAGTPTAVPAEPACDPPCYTEPEGVAILSADLVEQPSGLAASVRNPGLYYVVSDVAGTAAVVVITEDGSHVATLTIDGMSAANAEALATGPCGVTESTCLFIGDIGDHVGRPDVVVYRVAEPDLTEPPDASLAADVLRYTYPDGPTDAEALLVDAAGRAVIISKAATRDGAIGSEATIVYRGETDGGRLDRVGELDLPEPENPVFAFIVGNVVTGADTLRDGRVIVRTYDEVLEYYTSNQDADVAAFPEWDVRRVPTPSQIQSEAIAYRGDGCGYLVLAERTGALDVIRCDQG